jgi:hypothetical protein
MPSFVHSREIRLSAESLYQAIAHALQRIAAQSETGSIVLSTSSADAPSVISVPIEIAVMKQSSVDMSIAFTIKARTATSFFPKFKGTFHALAMSSARTTVRLKGAYRAPLGIIGSTIDAAGLHRLAKEGLHQLFERVVDESIASIQAGATRDHAVQAS